MAFLLTQLKDLYINLRGFHTKRQLVVFESDDWGSIRMPSRAVFDKLQTIGDSPEKDAFLRNDSLESKDDLLSLYEVLSSFSDHLGHSPIFTMNFAVANPDFDKIDHARGLYAYEPFYETYTKYYGDISVLDLIKEGYEKKLILPQLHCREHLNVNRWMKALQEGKPDTRLAFENRMIGIYSSFSQENPFGYMDAFHTDLSSSEDLQKILDDAVEIFNRTFGYNSQTFVASCFVWENSLEKALAHHGIKGIQGSAWQNVPYSQNGVYGLQRKLRFTGQKNRNGQIYTVRNCTYEPAYWQNPEECVATCLKELTFAFRSHKPAVINSHRFNYIGSIHPDNARNNLNGLRELLSQITTRFPNVEFVSSAELLKIIQGETNE